MAVAQIIAPARWHRTVAKQVAESPRLARELKRAAERPGLLAELTADEVRELAAIRPTDERVRKALVLVEEAELRERTRRRGAYQGI